MPLKEPKRKHTSRKNLCHRPKHVKNETIPSDADEELARATKVMSQRKKGKLFYRGHYFQQNNCSQLSAYWRCDSFFHTGCGATLITEKMNENEEKVVVKSKYGKSEPNILSDLPQSFQFCFRCSQSRADVT